MYPYFKIITYGNYSELESWCSHFQGLEIPYCITRRQRDDGDTVYAMWRIGTEAMTTEAVLVNPPNNEPLDGEIVEMWGGFEKYLEVENALSQL